MKPQLPLQKAPESICILRLSALGDITHVLPVVHAIRAHWPDCQITWICGAFEARMIQGVKGVRIIPFNKKLGWRAYRELGKALKGERFDVLLHMQVSLRANLASLFIRAPLRLGWDRARARDFHHWFTNHQIPAATRQHQVLGFLSFAQALGVPVSEPNWDFALADEAYNLAQKHQLGKRKTLIISPCSSHAIRSWHAQGYAEVADYAVEKYGFQVLLCGGPSEFERKMGADIEAAAKHPLINLIGKDTLPQLLALLQRADVVISPDSGPTHMASALATPVIGLHACTWSLRSGPFNSLDYCVDHFAQAATEYLHQEPEGLRWGTRIEQAGVMDLIKVDEVTACLDRVVVDYAISDSKN